MPARRIRTRPPGRVLERDLWDAGHELVAGMDEVGRGALAGPVSVGVVVLDRGSGRIPRGLRDSKIIPPAHREALCDPIRRWARASAVGHASAGEIDRWGIIAALRLAGQRALTAVAGTGAIPTALILDGQHDWLTAPAGAADPHPDLPVVLQVKADRVCASVAAASVLAKCERDALMTALHPAYPEFCWDRNKGYAAPEHLAALRARGTTSWHRRSWALPGVQPWVQEGMMDL